MQGGKGLNDTATAHQCVWGVMALPVTANVEGTVLINTVTNHQCSEGALFSIVTLSIG